MSIHAPSVAAETVWHEDVVAAVFVPRSPENFVATLRSLKAAKIPSAIGIPDRTLLGPLEEFDLDVIESWSAVHMVNAIWQKMQTNVLIISDAVIVPPGMLDNALGYLRGDLRVASVSFLCNAAAFLSFPHRNHPVERTVEGHDEQSLTRRLRTLDPVPRAAPIPMATGPAVLLSSVAFSVTGSLETPKSGGFAAALADFSFRARSRGFVDLLDPGTFYARPADISTEIPAPEILETGLSPDDNGWLHERHSTAHALAVDETRRRDSPLGLAHHVARAKILGIKVLIDGTCLGAQEMGTQVATVALIRALADSPQVREVCVALPGPIPRYAHSTLTLPKVVSAAVAEGRLPDFGRADVGHHPFQPNYGFDIDEWREHADRVFVTIHDLISYHIGAYSGDTSVWLHYRELIRHVVHGVDAVFVDSVDVAQQMCLNSLSVSPDRLFVVPLGTEHLNGEEVGQIPEQLLERGLVAAEFILCLGTNYTHKNRDLAIAAVAELRRRGHDLALVLAGPGVPWGSSRSREAGVGDVKSVYVLPDVTSEERNWLLRHASAVMYPTSAEGFGFIPYEAARFGTPTVFVPFGPLGEIAGQQPVLAADWRPESLANAAEQLLRDPDRAAQQVSSCLSAGSAYSWSATASNLITAYREILAKPPV